MFLTAVSDRFYEGSGKQSIAKLKILQVAESSYPLFPSAITLCDLTYSDNGGGDESPADFEEQRRRKSQHHLHIFKVVPVTCNNSENIRKIQGAKSEVCWRKYGGGG